MATEHIHDLLLIDFFHQYLRRDGCWQGRICWQADQGAGGNTTVFFLWCIMLYVLV
jgi:hypothetical protein